MTSSAFHYAKEQFDVSKVAEREFKIYMSILNDI